MFRKCRTFLLGVLRLAEIFTDYFSWMMRRLHKRYSIVLRSHDKLPSWNEDHVPFYQIIPLGIFAGEPCLTNHAGIFPKTLIASMSYKSLLYNCRRWFEIDWSSANWRLEDDRKIEENRYTMPWYFSERLSQSNILYFLNVNEETVL